jgi:CBS domain-containing protein
MESDGSERGASGEGRIADLMTPASAYRRVCEDEPVRRVVQVLVHSLFRPEGGGRFEQGHRSVLVYSRAGAFLGCLRLNDVLELLAPSGREQGGTTFQRGMLAARSRLIAGMTAGEILGEQRFVDIDAPLLEAVQLMVFDGLINIPVLRHGELVGVLTDKSVLREVCQHLTCGSDDEEGEPGRGPSESLPRTAARARRQGRRAERRAAPRSKSMA